MVENVCKAKKKKELTEHVIPHKNLKPDVSLIDLNLTYMVIYCVFLWGTVEHLVGEIRQNL